MCRVVLTDDEAKLYEQYLDMLKTLLPIQYRKVVATHRALLQRGDICKREAFKKNMMAVIGFISLYQDKFNTMKTYFNRLVDFVRVLTGMEKYILDVDKRDIELYYIYLTKKRQVSQNTLYLTRLTLRAFYKYHNREDIIEVLRRWKVKEELKFEVDLTEEEVNRILANIEAPDVRLACILMAKSGLRLGEALGLRWGDIKIYKDGTGVAYIKYRPGQRYGTKGEYSERTIPLSRDAIQHILLLRKKYIERYHTLPPEGARIIEGSDRRIRVHLRKAVRKAGIRKKYPITPHKLRHFFAHQWMRKVRDVTKLKAILGHSQIRTTLVYTKPSDKEIIEAYKEFEGKLA